MNERSMRGTREPPCTADLSSGTMNFTTHLNRINNRGILVFLLDSGVYFHLPLCDPAPLGEGEDNHVHSHLELGLVVIVPVPGIAVPLVTVNQHEPVVDPHPLEILDRSLIST